MLIACLLFSLNSNAQYKNKFEKDNTGLMITASGVVLGTIAVFVKDGGEYTYANGYNSTKVKTPIYNRVIMFGVSFTVSIGGLIYQHNHK